MKTLLIVISFLYCTWYTCESLACGGYDEPVIEITAEGIK